MSLVIVQPQIDPPVVFLQLPPGRLRWRRRRSLFFYQIDFSKPLVFLSSGLRNNPTTSGGGVDGG
jgi:hypothetical protein